MIQGYSFSEKGKGIRRTRDSCFASQVYRVFNQDPVFRAELEQGNTCVSIRVGTRVVEIIPFLERDSVSRTLKGIGADIRVYEDRSRDKRVPLSPLLGLVDTPQKVQELRGDMIARMDESSPLKDRLEGLMQSGTYEDRAAEILREPRAVSKEILRIGYGIAKPNNISGNPLRVRKQACDLMRPFLKLLRDKFSANSH